ncbi:MAG: hypothetical protein UT29_C0001G0037 [Candidatus Yanofskybacteria bacterium GW2011_GWA1_39_13]|uniref:Uncharacterized protein n=1 Tax=Yanofskybacteria sp. (strain GW2011_GWA1_39_13) TaxID=1619019 RepID=A0A0G0QLI3_YANXG|nr:MAG: hypothetical protein UT29_C0001G0037 [Candidatus Yanofskybacteria bacterium GW2011_GWA1_39_13]
MINKIKNFGVSIALASDTGYQGVDLTIQSVFGIITGLACWFTRFALILIVVYIIIYGIKFMTAQGNATKYEEAKKSFTWGLVGVLVILGTYTIIATIANGLGADYSLIVPLNCSN